MSKELNQNSFKTFLGLSDLMQEFTRNNCDVMPQNDVNFNDIIKIMVSVQYLKLAVVMWI